MFIREYGLNQTLRIVEIPKSTWYYYRQEKVNFEDKYKYLRKDLYKAIKENPAYGYRKLKAELEDVYRQQINHKTLKKLLNLWDVALPRVSSRPRKSRILKLIQSLGEKANLLKAIKDSVPFKVLITDFTWVYYRDGNEMSALITYEDYKSKYVLGYALGQSQNTRLAIEAWKKTKAKIKRLGIKIENIIVHQDQDPVFLSYDYVRQLVTNDKVILSFSAKGTPGDNAAKESFIGHFKKENRGLLLNAHDFLELKEVVRKGIKYYNFKRRHQSLGYLSPNVYLRKWFLELKKRV
jgi:putative transposase